MKSWVIGNWKLNPASIKDARALANKIKDDVADFQSCQLMVAPSYVHLNDVGSIVVDTSLALASQDVTALSAMTGAYTGDISVTQLKDIGVEWVIIGHSERRQYYAESNEMLLKKINHCVANDLGVIFCIGESESDYDAGQTKSVLSEQLEVIKSLELIKDMTNINDAKLSDKCKLIIAYEPVWAIGTGKVPSISEVSDVHSFIRQFLSDEVSNDKTDISKTPIIYGGSVKPENATSFAECDNINGVLVGGASLDAQSFLSIANSFNNVS